METRTVNKGSDDAQFRRLIKDLLSEADRVIKIIILEMGPNDSVSKKVIPPAEVLSRTEEKLTRLQRTNRSGVTKEPSSLYSCLNQYVKDHLNSCIREEIGRVRGSFGVPELYDSLVNACYERITESPQYEAFKEEIKSTIDAAAAELVTRDFLSGLTDSTDCPIENDSEDNAWSFYDLGSALVGNDGDTSSVTSSSDGGGAGCWLGLSSERLEELAERLDPRHHLTIRLEALRTIASLPVAELVTFDSWPYLKQQLVDILSRAGCQDVTTVLFDAGLHLHAKMLLSASSRCVVESFGNLTMGLYCSIEMHRHSRGSESPPFDGISWHAILQLAKLINAFQRAVPNYWTRFPEQHSRSIVEFTVRYLMDDVMDGATRVSSEHWTPLHLIGMIDSDAIWFHNWTRAEYGRRLVFRELCNHTDVWMNLVIRSRNGLEALGSLASRHCPQSSEKLVHLGICEVPHTYIEYCCILHVISIMGWVMLSTEGRRVCDEHLNSAGERFSTRQLLHAMLKMSIELSQVTGVCNRYCAARVVVDIFRRLIEQETSCQYYFVDDLQPIRNIVDQLHHWCDCPPNHIGNISNCDLHWLSHMATILFHLSDNIVSIPVLSRSYTPIIASFTERLLLISKDAVLPSDASTLEEVKWMVLKVCCRIFSTHDSIEVLCQTQLLQKVADEWESLLRQADCTPVPGAPTGDQRPHDRPSEWLQELSAIGSTPLGVALLRQADLLQDVVDWAEKEFKDRAEFSSLPIPTRLMMSQVATISDLKLGFADQTSPSVEFIAENIWMACECRCINVASGGSLPLTEEWLELHLSRLLSDLVCILPSHINTKSSLPSSHTLSEMTSSSTEVSLLARIVISGVEGSFANAEVIHEIGAHLLCLLATSLDTWLHLQARYLLQEALLQAQQLNAVEDTGELITDRIFIMRNYLLIKTSEIGGESEKLLPPNAFDQDNFDVESLSQWPMVISLPIPSIYLPPLPPVSSPPIEIDSFLKDTLQENLDQEWLTYCREVYRNCLTSEEQVQLRGKWFGQLLYYALQILAGKSDTVSSEIPKNMDLSDLTNVTELGMALTISYGMRLGLLGDKDTAAKSLINVLMSFQRESDMQEFDWITATIFLLMCGDPNRTTTFCRRLKLLSVEKQMSSCRKSTSTELFSTPWLTFCHNVEVVLKGDLPLVACALQWSGVSVGHVCHPWISQCFWNILDWEEICNYFGLCIVIGEDFIVYFVVALFRHLQTEIYQHARNGDVSLFLRETRVEGFCTRDYLPFMDHLESKYHAILQHPKQDIT